MDEVVIILNIYCYNKYMAETFERQPFVLAYFKWHYGKALEEFWIVAKNFLWFVTNFFSFKLLLKTLFAPWKRLGENYGGGFDIGAFASVLVVNTLMRLVGFVTKTIVLIVGLVSYILVLALTACFLTVWLLAPFVVLGSLILAVTFFVI